MTIKLILITPDLSTGEMLSKPPITLLESDYSGKTIKEVVSKRAFGDILENNDSNLTEQAIQLIFNFIQPVGIKNPNEWWNQSFESLISKDKEVRLELEFSKEGLEFISKMM